MRYGISIVLLLTHLEDGGDEKDITDRQVLNVHESNIPNQWRIQDFPDGGATTPEGGCANLLFRESFARHYMKMKEFGSRGGGACPWRPHTLDPPLQTVNHYR